MIRSSRELNVTKARLAAFEDSIAAFDLGSPPAGVQASAHRAAYDALAGLRDELVKEIQQYERLRAEGMAAVRISKLADLPAGLVQARIARGLSQAELAGRLGVKPQQVQRWETEEYENATFASVLDVANALGVAGCLQLPAQPANRASVSFTSTDFTWVPKSGHQPDLFVVAKTKGQSGRVRELVWKDGSIQFTEDKVRVSGLGGHDGEFQRAQPVKAVWRLTEGRSFRDGSFDG